MEKYFSVPKSTSTKKQWWFIVETTHKNGTVSAEPDHSLVTFRD